MTAIKHSNAYSWSKYGTYFISLALSVLISTAVIAAPLENESLESSNSSIDPQSTLVPSAQNQAAEKTSQSKVLTSDFERIVVTAKRGKSTLLTTPASVSPINQELLALIGHQHINQALGRIAGTWVSRGNGQEHLTALRSPRANWCWRLWRILYGIR